MKNPQPTHGASSDNTLDHDQELAQTRRLVMRYGWNTAAYQILNPGIALWFSPHREAVIGYVRVRNYCIVAGAPVCSEDCVHEVVREFEEHCASRGWRVWYFCAGTRLAESLNPLSKGQAVLLGAEPSWHPADFVRKMTTKASLRAQCARARNKGVVVELWDNDRASAHPALQECLTQWLSTRGLTPLHFLVEVRTLERLLDRKVFVATQADRIVAFSVVSPIPERRGWLVEQNVRRPDAPNGTIELLLLSAAQNLESEGAELISLGLSPLSRHAQLHTNTLWIRVLFGLVRSLAQPLYNFRGLDAFKTKFEATRWDPVYAISDAQRISPSVVYAIAEAFAGSAPIPMLMRRLRRRLFAPPSQS